LVAIIVFASVGGGAAYTLWRTSQPPPEDIRIGVCADLDMTGLKDVWQAAILAAEQVNAAGGVLGRNFTIVAEDDDSGTLPVDIAVATNALTKLITVDKADFVITATGIVTYITAFQDICADHEKIYFSVSGGFDEFTQRVLDNYERYKYFFRLWPTNQTTVANSILGDLLTLREYTGFSKVAYLFNDGTQPKALESKLKSSLPANGFEIVYGGFFPSQTTDFTSYFAAIEDSGAEILLPGIITKASIPFVKEWYTRQSPCVIWGSVWLVGAQDSNFWEITEGKCEYVSFSGVPVLSGYPLTSKTVPTAEAYLERWGANMTNGPSVAAYDLVHFILPDAIRRAGTTETNAVIKALESTNVETSMARHFVFTSSHDVFVGTAGTNQPAEDYLLVMMFQWQDGKQVPICPREIMEEVGAVYKFPSWQGPWSK
jgi:branched-chain amino acid transport system substrate-binding protein